MWGDNSGCWKNWERKKISFTGCAWRVSHKYFSIITDGNSGPYCVSASTFTFLISFQISIDIISTTVQHSAFPAKEHAIPIFVITKWRCKASISATNHYQKAPQFPKYPLTFSLSSICPWNSLLIPTCNLILCSYNDFGALGKKPISVMIITNTRRVYCHDRFNCLISLS